MYKRQTFGPFLLGNPRVREVFMKQHGDLLDVTFWQSHQARIQEGHVHDVFPYDPARRFAQIRRLAAEDAHRVEGVESAVSAH